MKPVKRTCPRCNAFLTVADIKTACNPETIAVFDEGSFPLWKLCFLCNEEWAIQQGTFKRIQVVI